MWLETEPAAPKLAQVSVGGEKTEPLRRYLALPAWLTLESSLYVLLVFVAALVRLAGLGDGVLAAAEGQRALAAWNVWRGQPVDLFNGPTLVYGTGTLFFLLGANDTLARALPAIAGVWLVAWPFFIRRELGRVEALFTSLLLAISPAITWASRLVASETIVLGLAAAGVLAWMRFRSRGERRWLAVAGIALGLTFGAGPSGFALLVPGALVLWLVALGYRWSLGTAMAWKLDGRWLVSAGALALLAVATGFGTNPGGLQSGVVDVAANWAIPGAGASAAAPRGALASSLLIYESSALLLSLLALFIVRERRGLVQGAVLFVAVAVVHSILAPSGTPERLALSAVALAIAGGQGLGRLWALGGERASYTQVGGFVGTAWPVLGLWGATAGYLALPASVVPPLVLLAPVLMLGLLAALWAYWRGPDVALLGLVALVTIALLLGEFRTGTSLAFLNRNSPAEPLAATALSGDLRNLVDEIDAHTAVMATPRRRNLPVSVSEALRQPLAWYLREYPRATYGDLVGQPTIVVASPGDPLPAGNYRYRSYVWETATGTAPSTLSQVWRWLIYREYPGPAVTQQALLYVAVQQAN